MTNPFIYALGKLVVSLHYKRKLDIYALCSVHNPTRYRRSQKKVNIPQGIRWAVWRRDNFTCVYCSIRGHALSLDHVIPEVYGGQAKEHNLVTACTDCNSKKANLDFEEFINSRWLKKKRHKADHLHSLITKGTPLPKLPKGYRLHNSRIIGDDF